MKHALRKARYSLALGTASVLLVFLVPVALAADFDSPRVQSASGVAPPDVGCNGGKVLVMRPGNIPSCVSEATAQSMSWPVFVRSFTVPDMNTDNDAVSDDIVPDMNTDDPALDSTTSDPYPPRTGTVHFKDLKRIKNPGDMYRNAYTEEEARITAQHIADALGYEISVDPDDIDPVYKYQHIKGNQLFYILLDENGDHIGNLLTNKVFSNEEMTRGSLHGRIHIAMTVENTMHEDRIEFITNLTQKYYSHGLEEINPTQLGYAKAKNEQRSGLKDLTLDESGVSPESFARFQNFFKDRPQYATIVDDNLIIYDKSGDGDIKYWATRAGGATDRFRFNQYTPNGATFQLSPNLSDESREQFQRPISKEEARKIVFDFLSTSPIFNDNRYGCNIELDYDGSEVRKSNVSGVLLYNVVYVGDCRHEYIDPALQKTKNAENIYVDALTGQFINIGSTFGQCYGYDEDECVVDAFGRQKFKVDECWCPSPPQKHQNGDYLNYSCYDTPVPEPRSTIPSCTPVEIAQVNACLRMGTDFCVKALNTPREYYPDLPKYSYLNKFLDQFDSPEEYPDIDSCHNARLIHNRCDPND